MVDIIMPCYNSEKFLSKSIESVIVQTYDDWRLWFVDNGSTDESFKLALAYAKMNRKIRICVEVGLKGPSAARNMALELICRNSKSDLIAFIDSDDFWYEKHLEKSINVIKKEKVDFVYSGIDLRFENGEQAFPNSYLKQPPFVPPVYISTVVIKSKCFSTVGGFNGLVDGREDWLMWLKIKAAGYKMKFLPDILTQYTVRKGGVAGSWNQEKEDIFQREIAKLSKGLKRNG